MYIWLRLAIGRKCRSHSAWLVGRERAECWHNLGVGLRQHKRSVCRLQAGLLLCMGHPATADTSFPTQAPAYSAVHPAASSNPVSYDVLSDITHTVYIDRRLSGKSALKVRSGAVVPDGIFREGVVSGFIGDIHACDQTSQSNYPYGDAASSGFPSTGSIPDVATGTPERSGGTWMPLFAAPLKRGGHAGISAPWTHRWL